MKTLSFKVTEKEAKLIRQSAKREKLTVSEFLRSKALPERNEARVQTKTCPLTGVKIFTTSGKGPQMTTDTVREMLSDFP